MLKNLLCRILNEDNNNVVTVNWKYEEYIVFQITQLLRSFEISHKSISKWVKKIQFMHKTYF